MSEGKVIVLEDNFDAVRHAVTSTMLMDAAKAGGFVVEGHAKINASKGGTEHLNIRTGALVNSIIVDEVKKSETRAEVGIGTNLVYARIHELGGIIKNAFGRGITVHMPARPYLRPAMDENESDIRGAVVAEIWRNLFKATR